MAGLEQEEPEEGGVWDRHTLDTPWQADEKVWSLPYSTDRSWQIQTDRGRILTTVYSRRLAEHIVNLHNQSLPSPSLMEGDN